MAYFILNLFKRVVRLVKRRRRRGAEAASQAPAWDASVPVNEVAVRAVMQGAAWLETAEYRLLLGAIQMAVGVAGLGFLFCLLSCVLSFAIGRHIRQQGAIGQASAFSWDPYAPKPLFTQERGLLGLMLLTAAEVAFSITAMVLLCSPAPGSVCPSADAAGWAPPGLLSYLTNNALAASYVPIGLAGSAVCSSLSLLLAWNQLLTLDRLHTLPQPARNGLLDQRLLLQSGGDSDSDNDDFEALQRSMTV